MQQLSLTDEIVKQESVEEIIISLEKRDEMLNKLGKILWKWEVSKLLNDSIVLRFVTKKWNKVNGLSNGFMWL